jgi:hypothetical protein
MSPHVRFGPGTDITAGRVDMPETSHKRREIQVVRRLEIWLC